ncbi:phosphoenolpyruvate--protein phosphotransferase [Anaerocolumna xylanovorans]|uniref:Phosphoenolpyruvate-protein phosphotransferase n=1 Tax=Anaerocolumna xylanovorans DSM 12503 TaxID=1121345 RepID=A0A1M7Y195_9FIRM|nr:phosphoenolpyruvate--protein phosphotransferase [Anaerocolumna xylanovorans]SHO45279.1 phosphoenolpyruvate--protein phosphotransferase [Anaerocolumna xylanovorans DSM 12503]
MKKYTGKSAFQGIAIGKIRELNKREAVVRRTHIDDVNEEIERFVNAKATAVEQLQILYDKAVKEVGTAQAAIFEIHQMMLEDEDYLDSIFNIITKQMVNAEYAVAATEDHFTQILSSMDDEYMQERAADIKDISKRLINILSQAEIEQDGFDESCILVADDLAPSETIQLDKEKVIAFVTREGSVNSHTAILARTMNIPAVVNVCIPQNVDGETGIVDGKIGAIFVSPEKEILYQYQEEKIKLERHKKLLQELKGKETVTTSGKKIKLYANIGSVEDVGSVLQNDAEGVGLFRSEFLYLQENHYPTEEEQFNSYRTVAEMMGRKKVIIRTLDIGADKQIDYFNLKKEENPALGFRAIRICLTREDIFKTQLRAIYRASAFGNISIMIPMITSKWEVDKVKEIICGVKNELSSDGIPFGIVEFGIMIETPAAVMISEVLAEQVDFFSIGTNDLTQYTLAIDRQNPSLDRFYDSHHPAILRMLQMTIENGHKGGAWVGICGELGADVEVTEQLIKMGIDEISVSPSMVFPLREKIRSL